MAVRKAHFRVHGRFDGAPEATVSIIHDGMNGLFQVRPLRRRRTYALTLTDVAEMVMSKVILAEVRASGRKVPRPRR